MIRVRKFVPDDAEAVARLLVRDDKDVRHASGLRDLSPAKNDSIFVAEISGHIVGVMAERLIPAVHTFEIADTSASRRVAEALTNYSLGFTQASGYREGMFYIDSANVAMRRFVEACGAKYEGQFDVFTLEVR